MRRYKFQFTKYSWSMWMEEKRALEFLKAKSFIAIKIEQLMTREEAEEFLASFKKSS